jgi:alkylation response protein AidB-like acyl-CoA dehydrogenase
MARGQASPQAGTARRQPGEGLLAEEIADVTAAKKVTAYTVNHALIHCGKDVKNEQQVMEAVADMMIALLKMESTVCRAHRRLAGSGQQSVYQALAQLCCYKNAQIIAGKAREVLQAVTPAGQQPRKLANLRTLNELLQRPLNTIHLKRVIADAVIEAGGYRL